MNQLLKRQKIGFLGAGNMAQAIIKGMLESGVTSSDNILASNRTPGKLQKLHDQYKIQTIDTNESLVENSDIVVLAVKPQDLLTAIEPIASSFTDDQIVISLAAGITNQTLQKYLPQVRLVRMMPNTPSIIGRGVIGYLPAENDEALSALMDDLCSPLGYTLKVEDEDQFEALMVSCSSGTGFVLEMMMYWQDWIVEHGFDEETAKRMTLETFMGASMLAAQSKDIPFEELQSRVTSKKGVTAAGLQSMRELEIERALRISFEKAAMRSKEISREIK
ncbi:pyrroline-5-carboxylate reductase [Bdellovibrio sp. HCB337]|uniref:pyrroline-5-carboxylate reductase n=1 Tax=Bdellovibrio sp. HCB337 TaxID=3394358 RepID=UPI0039A77D1E